MGAIVFDHLVPELPTLEGMYDFYIPDMTYDGYKWENGIWEYHEDYIAWNDNNSRIQMFGPTDDGDDSEYISVRDVWINPVDAGNPLNGNDAIAPIDDMRDNKGSNTSTRNGKGKKRKVRIFKRKVKPISAIGDDGSLTKKKKKKKKS